MTNLAVTQNSRRGAYALLIAAILIYAFLFCFKSGERGFFPLDQSIMFDGSYRIMSGQIPYKDFVIPVGPMVFGLQAIVFKLFGVSFASYLFGAAVANVLASVLSIVCVSTLFPEKRYPAIIAGLLTATWFYPPYGSPNMEQTAFFFSLLGITCSVVAICRPILSHRVQGLLLGLAGASAVLSFLSKQNAGAFILPVFPLMFLAAFAPKRREIVVATAWLSLGVVIAVGTFIAWLVFYSSPELFREHFFRIPGREGMTRLLDGKWRLIRLLLGVGIPEFVRTGMSVSMYLGVVALWGCASRRWLYEAAPRKSAVAAVLCFYLPVFQTVFRVSTNNQWQECLPFVGIVVACAVGLAAQVLERRFERATDCETTWPSPGWGAAALLLGVGILVSQIFTERPVAAIALALVAAGGALRGLQWKFAAPAESPIVGPVGTATAGIRGPTPGVNRCLFGAAILIAVAGFTGKGIRVSWDRSVHDIFAKSKFTNYMTIPGLESLKWGHPTSIHGTEFSEDDLAALVERLKLEKKPFFIFPDFTILYGLVGRPSPQPLLWFHQGLTYPRDYDRSLDRRLVDSLSRQDVELIVLEKECWWESNQLEFFPLLDSYIEEAFAPEDEIGPFAIRRRVPAQSPQ